MLVPPILLPQPPGAAAVDGAVEPNLVARAAVVDGRPAHRVGVVEMQDD
jgi:hypothetical protein